MNFEKAEYTRRERKVSKLVKVFKIFTDGRKKPNKNFDVSNGSNEIQKSLRT